MKYLVHIGYPKAASTWLQNTVFSGQDPRIKGLGFPDCGTKPGGGLFLDSFGAVDKKRHYVSPFDWPNKDKVARAIAETTPSDCEVTVLSNEVWAGHPHSGGVTGQILADRIYSVLPNAHVLIVVRNQLDSMFSAYSDYLDRWGGLAKLDSLLVPKGLWDQAPSFSPIYYDYRPLIRYYDQLFGREKVIVVPFELIKESTDRFAAEVYDGLGLDVDESIQFKSTAANVRDYNRTAILSRMPWINLFGGPKSVNSYFAFSAKRFRNTLLNVIGKMVSDEKVKSIIAADKERIRECWMDGYKDSNRWLSERTGCDLKELGWHM